MESKNIGIDVPLPKEQCSDVHCPFHGSLKVARSMMNGVVVSGKMHKTATVEWSRKILLPKFERYESRRSRIKVHNPPCISAKEGDFVKVARCRPLSKSKNFVIIENLGPLKGFAQRMESMAESKVREKKQVKPASDHGHPAEEDE